MQQPLLGDKARATGRLSGERRFLPTPEKVAADCATKMDERPDLFSLAGTGWETGLQPRAMANLCLIKGLYLREMDVPEKLGPLAQLRLVLHDLRRKNDLIKLSLALESLLAKLHNAKSIADLIVGQFPLIATDYPTVAGEPLRMEDAVTLEMLGLLCFMLFSSMQPGPNSSVPDFVPHGFGCVPASALTEDPAHFQFTGIGWSELKEATQSQSKQTKEGRMHPMWLSHDMLFPMMNCLIVNSSGKGGVGTGTITCFEVWVRSMFADLLGNVGVIVKVRIDNSISLQNKMLSLFTTAATTLSGWMLHMWASDSQHQ